MPQHVAGWLEDIDSAGVFANLTALVDQRLFTQGDDIRVPDLNLIFAAAGGADAVVDPRFRLDSPTLDAMVRYEVTPLNAQNAAAVEPDTPQKVDDMRLAPLQLGVDEILQVQLNNNPAAAREQWLLVWFADQVPQPVTGGRPFTVRMTGTTTLVVNVWNTVVMTLDENLPPGNYQVIGLRPLSLGCVAGRLIFRTGQFWRPGALGLALNQSLQHPMFRHGALGVWGEFPFTQLPAIEYLSVVAATVETVHLDLMRVGG